MKKPNISISLIKSLNQIDLGTYCPLLFEAIYITKQYESEPSEAMKKGHYLEYILTGATLRDGSIPQAKTTKTGLAADYQYIENHKPTWEAMKNKYQLTEIETSETLEVEYKGWNLKGILDVKCKMQNNPVIIDIKSTGKIDDKWSEYGWEAVEHKPNLYGQAIFYKYMYYKKYGVLPDFYFAIFSTTAKPLAKFIKVNIPFVIEEIIEQVEKNINFAIAIFDYHNTIGFKPSCKFYHCLDCGWEDCPSRMTTPEVTEIEIMNLKF